MIDKNAKFLHPDNENSDHTGIHFEGAVPHVVAIFIHLRIHIKKVFIIDRRANRAGLLIYLCIFIYGRLLD